MRSRSAIEDVDVAGATFVVGSDLKVADFTSIQEAIDNLPTEGGSICILGGTYSLTTTITLPNKPVKVIGSGMGVTVLSLGSSAIAAFSITVNNRYTFEDFTISGTGLAGQRAWNVTSGIVSPKNQQCFHIRTEAIEKVLNVPSGIFSFEFVCCQLELAVVGAGTERIVDAPSGGTIRATDTNMCVETGGGGFTGTSIEVQFLRCTFKVFNGVTFSGGGENPFLIGCNIYGIVSPGVTIALGNYRLIGNRFQTTVAGIPCLLLSSGSTTVKGNHFTHPVGETAISVTSGFNIVVGNNSCKVVESGSADNNVYDANGIFSTSTIIGPNSIVNGIKKKGVTAGATTGSFVDQFTHLNPNGVGSYGTVKNTGGANALEVRETGIDAFGTTTSVTTAVAAGATLVLSSCFSGLGGTSFPPFVSYTIAIRHPVAATTFNLQFAGQGAL